MWNSQSDIRFPDPKRWNDESKDEIFSLYGWYNALFGRGKVTPYDAKGSERWLDQELSHAIIEGEEAQYANRPAHCEAESWPKAAVIWGIHVVTRTYPTKIDPKEEGGLELINWR
jgi:hypothetical protein